jgi:hypothetical protein
LRLRARNARTRLGSPRPLGNPAQEHRSSVLTRDGRRANMTGDSPLGFRKPACSTSPTSRPGCGAMPPPAATQRRSATASRTRELMRARRVTPAEVERAHPVVADCATWLGSRDDLHG